MRKLLLVLLFASFFLKAYSQPKHLGFDHLNNTNGLPENDVNAMVQDNLGYVWFATQAGLVRYNGYETKIYKPGVENKHTLPREIFDNVFEDNKHILWALSVDQGLFKYDRANDH